MRLPLRNWISATFKTKVDPQLHIRKSNFFSAVRNFKINVAPQLLISISATAIFQQSETF
jgi:hypothetical protein